MPPEPQRAASDPAPGTDPASAPHTTPATEQAALDRLPASAPKALIPSGKARALLAILHEHHLAPAWAGHVLRHAAQTGDGWRVCCAGSCEVCVEQLGRAVDAWRRNRDLP